VASAGVGAAGQSPSGAFAEITIDSGSSMSGSEHGQDVHVKSDNEIIAERSEIQRAASPAKRSAGEMEGTVKNGHAREQPDSNEDVAMAGTSNDLYDQDTGVNSAATSVQGTMTSNTSATSFQSDDPPPYSANTEEQWKVAGGAPAPGVDEQVQEVMQLLQKPLDHGDRGSVVSAQWLHKVMSRTTENQHSTNFPKAAREGDIGPVDNSDIVPANAFEEPILHDINGHPYIPLKQGLTMEEDYQILPDQAWGMIVGWYGIKAGQKQITRYAHNTAPAGAVSSNIQYETYPPVFLVRKVPQPVEEADKTVDRARSAALELREKHERRQRGQMKPDDALMIVSSRQERGHKFLTRVKQFAGIPLNHKVLIWRVLSPTNIAVDKPDNTQSGVASPPLSRDTSPSFAQAERNKLVVDAAEWKKMEIGKDIEQIDMTDQTANENYNGSSTIEIFSLFENQTLILEEQTRGPAGGEYLSDLKKKQLLAKNKTNGSKSGSTVTSRRTSPAPGSTVTTRGRRRDGKTRGTVGLTNLGNTCYMNSALQCIRSVEELAIYFLQDKYKSEINPNNPLGSGGVMAKKYAELLQGVYGDNASSSFSPTNFKKTLSSQNPVFSGWGQQDSQEFLSYLVDSIHEDLNRIQKKPYLENPDSDDARVTDPEYIKELGDIYRQNHAKRNESVCMDLFSGFYKNTMECPTCDKVSVTFDPFASLTLQLPIESTVMHNFTFVPLNGTPKNHNLDLEKNLTVKDIKKIIASKHDNVDPNKLWMVEVYSHKMYKHFDDRTTVAEAGIQSNDYIFVYELADVPTNIPPRIKSNSYSTYTYGKKAEDIPEMDSDMAGNFAVPIFHRKKNRYGNGWDVTMHPQYVTIKCEESRDYNAILKKVLHTVAQLTSRPILVEAHENERTAPSDAEQAETNGDAENAQDDAARLSDHSIPSEDGYVAVSVDGGKAAAQTDSVTNGENGTAKTEGARIPDGFHHPDYKIPAVLRDQLFTVSYAKGVENMFCTGTSGFEEKSARKMSSRVKIASRRPSTSSSTADDASTNDGSSPVSMEGEDEESDEDEESAVQISTEDSPVATDDTASDAADSELPDDPLQNSSSNRARGNKKENKFKGNKSGQPKKEKLSKKAKRDLKKARARAAASSPLSQRSVNGNDAQDGEVYYLKLGECIVLDWYPEAIESIFGGNQHDDDDVSGRWLSEEDGKGLPFVHDPATDEKRNRREMRKKHGITLEDCFMETGKREKLSEDNAWYCNRCKELRQATKTLEIWTCPDIVVVHLKRFGGTRSFRDKIDVLVDYPIEGLDLTEKIGQKEDGKSYIYDLFAVDNHFGGLGGGHYTACAKNFFDGQWYDYNGKRVADISLCV
jgi:ubiquitin carboxyl-terminal hydrolase 4/11/15